MIGNITINATFTETNQVVLDLSGTTVTDNEITSITLNVAGNTPLTTSTLVMINGLTNNITPILGKGTDAKWIASTEHPGTLVYTVSATPSFNFPTPGTTNQNSSEISQSGFSHVGATTQNISAAVPLFTGNNVLLDKNNYIIPSTINNTIEVPSNFVNTLSTKTPEQQIGALGIIGRSVLAYNKPLGTNAVQAVFDVVDGLGWLPDSVQPSAMSADTSQVVAGVAATEGLNGLQQQFNAVNNASTHSASSASANTVSLINTQLGNTPVLPFGSGINQAPLASEGAASDTTNPTLQNNVRIDAIPNISESTAEIQPRADLEEEMPGEDLQAIAYGVAAGSTPYDKYGVWGSINFGQANQKVRNGNPGFKSLSQGSSIGVDTMINESTTVGINFSHAVSKVKYKGNSQGNKTDISTWIGAAYGNHQFSDKWFVRGTVLLNKTHINNKSLRKIVGGFGVAQAKYNMISYGGDAYIGFTQRFRNQTILTPIIGMRILHNQKISYGETGNTGQNIHSKQQALTSYSWLGGASISHSFLRAGINLIPEAHINTQYGINSKGPKGSFVSPLNPNETTTFIGTSPSKLNTIYGVSFTSSTDRFECVMGADVSISDKYVGYQGNVKLKVKF